MKHYDEQTSQERELSFWLAVERVLMGIAIVVIVAVVCTIIAISCTSVANASPLDCESIHNADQRHFCRALSKPQKSECEFIKDPDLRHQCRARVK